jgi:pyruvate,water dikinase
MLPQVQRHIDFLERTNLEMLSPSEMVNHLDATLTCAEQFWDLHFRTVNPELLAISQFEDLCHDLFDEEAPFSAYRLLQGFDNLTMQANLGLWRLSRAALAADEVRSVLAEREVRDVIPALRDSLSGRAFLAELDRYLNEFGRRGDLPLSFEFPSWIDDPAPVIANLKQFIRQPDLSLEDEWAAQVQERERAVASARAQLAGYPEPVVARFELLLSAAQVGIRIHEDHNYWIELRAMYEVRRVLVECGRRLAEAKVIARADDLFHLTPEEVRSSLAYLATAECSDPDAFDRSPVVALRQAEMERFQSITPPMALGTSHGALPDTPMARAVGKMFGRPLATPTEAGVLRGHPGSPGKVRGMARVIRSITDGSKLRIGDVLVAETTMPTWTPLFATASAVVTDVGGVLSHCAVVAREYGIPAVVGVGVGTSTIEDGQTVEVDGDTGVVRIIGG